MNSIVEIQNNQAVTSSLRVAEDFDKEHRVILKAIDDLKEGLAQKYADLFWEDTYVHPQNKQSYRVIYMNRDGFTLAVLGFNNTSKVLEFKLKYIAAFNRMEEELQKPRILSDKEQLMASMKLSIEANETLEHHDERIKNLEENMRIDGIQERKLQNIGNRVVIKSLGGKGSPAYKSVSRKAFSEMWRDFKNHFMIPRFSELPKVQFDEGLRFISMWQPSTSLKIEIDNVNMQQVAYEVE